MNRRISIFLRHGEYHQLVDTPSAHQPFSLTETGFQQARHAATLLQAMLRTHGWRLSATVHVSSLLRAWQTATSVLEELDTDHQLIQTDRLAERGVGSAANLSRDKIAELVRSDPRQPPLPADWKLDSYYCLPFIGAESLLGSGQRVADYVADTLGNDDERESDGAGEAVLFVGHGGSFRHAAHHMGILAMEEVASLSMFHARPLAFIRESGVWRHVDGEWKKR